MVNARNFVAALSVSLFCSAAQAQDFRNWNQFANWCRSTGGTPLPAPPRCIPQQSPPVQSGPPRQSAPAQPPAQPAPSPDQIIISRNLRNYSDLLEHIRREIPTFAEDEDKEALTTPDDLHYWLSVHDDELNEVIESTDHLLDEAIYDRDHAQTIAGEIAEVDKDVETLEFRNSAMGDYMTAATKEQHLFRDFEIAQRRLARSWIEYARPRDLPPHYYFPYHIDVPGEDILTRPADVLPRDQYVDPPPMAAESHARPHPAKTFVATGTGNSEAIYSMNLKVDHLSSTKRQLDEVKKQYDPKWLGEQEKKLSGLKDLRDREIFEGKQLLKQVPTVHANFVVAAVEALAWNTYTSHVAVAEAQHFYDVNKSWYQLTSNLLSDDSVEKTVEAGKSALEVLSSKADGIQGFLDVQKRTLDLLGDAQRFMSEAPEIIANGTPMERQSFSSMMADKQSAYYLGVMKDAKRDLGPFTPFAQAMMGADVPVPYQGIAKWLGFGN